MGLSKVAHVSLGSGFGCALTTGDTVYCWGDNTYGELGDGTTQGRATPAQIQSLSSVVDLDTSLLTNFACAVTVVGSISCWGRDDWGQLGHSLGQDGMCGGMACNPSPVPTGTVDALHVSAGAYSACASKTDHSVWCWGANTLGQLGNGTLGPGPNPSPTQVMVNTSVTQLSTKSYGGCLATTSGDSLCWGWNEFGDLGTGALDWYACDAGPSPCAAVPVKALLPPSPRMIATGVSFGIALDADGGVWSWGANLDGRLGHAPLATGSGDITNCAGGGDASVCNPTPGVIMGL
jgi:alpha-tubulin suppressor-like RCC1 family protein